MLATTKSMPAFDQKAYDEKVEREEEERVDRFNRLYADYLRAAADAADSSLKPDEDDLTKKCEAECEGLWSLIRTKAERDYQINYKIDVYRKILGEQWADGRTRAMFESIISDCARLGDLTLED